MNHKKKKTKDEKINNERTKESCSIMLTEDRETDVGHLPILDLVDLCLSLVLFVSIDREPLRNMKDNS